MFNFELFDKRRKKLTECFEKNEKNLSDNDDNDKFQVSTNATKQISIQKRKIISLHKTQRTN
jgi:hypothetical protein